MKGRERERKGKVRKYVRKAHCGKESIHRKDRERTTIHCVYQQKEKELMDNEWYYIFIINISAVVLSISITPLPAGQIVLQTP